MRNSLSRFPIRWILLAGAVVLIVGIAFSSVGKPPDDVRKLHVSPRFNRFQRQMIMSAHYGKITYQPQYVALQSNGPKFRAYLLDLSSIKDSGAKVDAFMKASEEIERGEEPTKAPIKAKAIGVSEARFGLAWFPWSLITIDYMLVVAGDEETTVEVRVNYGR